MALVDNADRPRPERKPLPSKEQIMAIADIPSLEAMQEEVSRIIAKIEVDLEYEVGDDEWDGRARGALAAHRICLGTIGRRLGQLRGKKGSSPTDAEVLTAKAAKLAAHADKQRAHADAMRAAKENKHAKLLMARLDFIERISLQSFFMRSAAKLLSQEDYDRVMEDANKRMVDAIKSHVPVHALGAPSSMDRTSGFEPDDAGSNPAERAT